MAIQRVTMDRITRKIEQNEDIKYLESNELDALFRVIKGKRDTALFRLAYHRGLRASEVGILQMMDLDRTNTREWTLEVTRLKGSKSGRFPLLAAEQTFLRAYLRKRGTAPAPSSRAPSGARSASSSSTG